jgi:hypothetical protein
LTEADFSSGSEYIFALICVVMASSFGLLLQATARNKEIAKTETKEPRRTMNPP